jgi:hypothetical protein
LSSGCDWFTGLARLARSSFIASNDSEFIAVAIPKVLDSVSETVNRIVVALDPFTTTLTLLDVVTCDRPASLVCRRCPLEAAAVGAVRSDFWSSRCIGSIEWALGYNRLSFKRFASAIDILCTHSEHVALAIVQSFDSEVSLGAEARNGFPAVNAILCHLDHIASDFAASVVLRR